MEITVRLAHNLSATVKGKLGLGVKILKAGGLEKIFKYNLSVRGEKLLMASQCYLLTTAGPIEGLLFISTDKDRSIKLSSPTVEFIRIRYKVHQHLCSYKFLSVKVSN